MEAALLPIPEKQPAELAAEQAVEARSEALGARPETARLHHIEQALTILASVVARLAKEAQQSRIQFRAGEAEPNVQEERRVQRELVRSLQARLTHIEERMERQSSPQEMLGAVPQTAAAALALASIRESLAGLAKRRQALAAAQE